MSPVVSFVLVFFLGVFLVIVPAMIGYLYYSRLFYRSLKAQHPVPLGRIIGMTFRGLKPHRVVDAYLQVRQSGRDVSLVQVEDLSKSCMSTEQIVTRLAEQNQPPGGSTGNALNA
jgi:uncharacterized protein YqfA (UPF0365 family)